MDALDDWPEQVGLDTNTLLEQVGLFAQDMIRRDGMLWPCGGAITPDGTLEPFALAPDDSLATVDEALAFLLANVIQNRDLWRAVCLAVAVTLPDGDDALQFNIEHVTGQCAAFIMRFRQTGPFRYVKFEPLACVLTDPVIWAPPG